MRRLFGCTDLELIYKDEHGEQFVCLVASPSEGEFWWDPERKPDEPMLWESRIRVG